MKTLWSLAKGLNRQALIKIKKQRNDCAFDAIPMIVYTMRVVLCNISNRISIQHTLVTPRYSISQRISTHGSYIGASLLYAPITNGLKHIGLSYDIIITKHLVYLSWFVAGEWSVPGDEFL